MAKIALIGAGSVVWARPLMMDMLGFEELRDSTFSLMDIDPVRLDTSQKTVERLVAQLGAPARVEGTLNRREAVRGGLRDLRGASGDARCDASGLRYPT